MRVQVFGSCRVWPAEGDEPVEVGARKPRSIMAALAMTPGRPVSADLLADLVWGGEPPAASHGALHSYLSGLRRVLEPGRPARAAGSVIETTDHGYVLRVDPGGVDTHAFAAEVRSAERTLAPLLSQLSPGSPGGAESPWPSRSAVGDILDALDVTLARWRGDPYADLPDHPDVLAERTALEQLRGSAEELRLLALLALGEHAGVLSATEPATARHQLRERLWALHAVALARTGRQADALAALRTARGVLADELGLDPGAELRAVEQAVLRQDPALARVLTPDAVASVEPGRTPPSASASSTLVGRTDELATIRGELDRALAGTFGCVQLVGEPGIGKSRLVEELTAEADPAVHVAAGRCEADEGAPPLWPWRSVLADLAVDLEELVTSIARDDRTSTDQRAFLTAEAMARTLLERSRDRPLLLVLEDLHWADDATLRVLQHLLVTAPPDAAVCVLLTRRAHPVPTGRLGLVVEALARRHATTLQLAGLDGDTSATLLRGLTEASDEALAEWSTRAHGNPYFLIELARLGESGTSARLPGSVREVVARRVEALSPQARQTLSVASLVGQSFRLAVVAAASGLGLEAVADALDEAVEAGVLVEDGPEAFSFRHALAREAVYESATRTRRARTHAAVAHALAVDPLAGRGLDARERTAEVARHWLAAGPSYAHEAWPTARAAAGQARELAAYAEAASLRAAAVTAHRQVSEAALEERYDLLLELADDAAHAARWTPLEAAVAEAVALGRRLGSADRVATAASAMSRYCVWVPHDFEVVLDDLVDDLRWALAQDGTDDEVRCRLQLSLAVELYYAPDAMAERRALVQTGMATARRLGDPALHWWAARAAWMASWTPALLPERLALSEEGVAAARRGGDTVAEAVSLVGRAIDLLESADLDGWLVASESAARIARRDRLPFALLTLDWLDFTLAALRGQTELADRSAAAAAATTRQVALPMQEVQAAATATLGLLWDPDRLPQVIEQMVSAQVDDAAVDTVVHLMLARCGYVDRLRADLSHSSAPVSEDQTWSTVFDWCCEAEAAFVVGDAGLASRAARVLAPVSGRIGIAGAVLVMGPVDGYLALALATLGDLSSAKQHADVAESLARDWQLAAYLTWLATHRASAGF